jgi:hypothetical protein
MTSRPELFRRASPRRPGPRRPARGVHARCARRRPGRSARAGSPYRARRGPDPSLRRADALLAHRHPWLRARTRALRRTEAGYFYSAYSFCAPEHGGTHLDAPIHFGEGRWTADQIPVERLVRPAVRDRRDGGGRRRPGPSPRGRGAEGLGSASTAASRKGPSSSCARAGARTGRTGSAILGDDTPATLRVSISPPTGRTP